jgi:hypothetical protein
MQLPFIKRAGTDPDALAYFARAGIASGTQTPTAYDNAASFNGTNQFLSVASNSTLTVTGSSFTFATWANAVNTTPNQILISKRDAAGNAREYQVSFNAGGLTFSVFPDGSFANSVSAVVGAGTVNSWNFYVCRYDASAGTIGASINGGAFTTTSSVPALTIVATNPVQFGANPGPALYYTGQLASVGFWKRALTASEVTALFNNGAGRTYASLDSGLRTNLISWWALNGTSSAVSLTDSHGVVTGTPNNLTNNGTVTAPNIGPIVTTTQNSRQLINNFVKGIKSLGLWNSMVCWPLRSSQNAGSGVTAFSLGGLGQFNGTLVNAPTWGENGIRSTGSGAIPPSIVLTGTSLSNYSARTWMAIINPFAETADNVIAITSNYSLAFTGSGQGIQMGAAAGYVRSQAGVNGNFSQLLVSPAPTKNIFSVLGTAWNAGTIQAYVNSSPNNASGTSGLSPMTDSNAIRLMGMNAGAAENRGLDGIMAGFLDIRTNVSSAQWAAVYSLYKQTLGLGLGLP